MSIGGLVGSGTSNSCDCRLLLLSVLLLSKMEEPKCWGSLGVLGVGDGGWIPEFGLGVVSVQLLLSWKWWWSAVVGRCICNRESSSRVSDWCYKSGGRRECSCW